MLVDGERRAKSHRLEGGEAVIVELPAGAPPAAEERWTCVAWEDEHLLVVDKPAGVVVHPGAGHDTGTLSTACSLDAAGGDDERPGIVHRLDRDTSGLLVVARSEEAHERLQELIRRREVERSYLALVKGSPCSRTGRIEAPDRARPARPHPPLARHADAAKAVTRFAVGSLGPRALLEVTLETGRTHPDPRPSRGDRAAGAATPSTARRRDLGLERQFLHAARLAFDHLFTGERVEVTSPLPDDLAAALERARELA